MTARAPHRRTRFLRQGSRDPERAARRGRTDEMQQSYFALFDLEPRFTLPAGQLDHAYRALAARVHPDRYAQAAPAEQREAHTLAANANEAYRTLRKPVLRAQHLLGLRGVATAGRGAAMSQTFLIEQMEWREALGDARTARDAAALRKLGALVRTRATALQARLAVQLDTEHDNSAAADTVQQLMFVEKLVADIDDACAYLED